ncbi:MAG: DUF362 domain-containing protein [Thermoclostridium sp.]|nr:DUF362 domain-containing protein [Thermoclostridium sp.]
MKKRIIILITIILAVSFMTGCNKRTAETDVEPQTTPAVNTVAPTEAVGPEAKVTYDKPKVFMTSDISTEGLMAVYEALGRPAEGKTAIKLHFGEPGNKNYISPDLLKDLVIAVDGTFTDSNTYYGGKRMQTAAHLQAAEDHGFTYAPVDILDADGEIMLPITGGKRLTEVPVGSHYENYDFIISIAHFKGHEMAGFGGTFKNLAVGIASVNGKKAIHAEPGGGMFSTQGEAFLEKIVEVTKAILEDKGDKMVFINVMNNLSVDCDCASSPAKPKMSDIGILASLDPVALDQASVDLVFAAPESESKDLVNRIKWKQGQNLLDYAQELGLGSKEYELVKLDD